MVYGSSHSCFGNGRRHSDGNARQHAEPDAGNAGDAPDVPDDGLKSNAVPDDEHDGKQRAAAMFGKFCISASFAVLYVYAAELFPTVIRNVGMGMATVASRIGGILCPFVVLMGEQSRSLPMFIFACMSLVAGLVGLRLPETKGHPMPETMEDLERSKQEDVKVIKT